MKQEHSLIRRVERNMIMLPDENIYHAHMDQDQTSQDASVLMIDDIRE